jgi:hypothetical protein
LADLSTEDAPEMEMEKARVKKVKSGVAASTNETIGILTILYMSKKMVRQVRIQFKSNGKRPGPYHLMRRMAMKTVRIGKGLPKKRRKLKSLKSLPLPHHVVVPLDAAEDLLHLLGWKKEWDKLVHQLAVDEELQHQRG